MQVFKFGTTSPTEAEGHTKVSAVPAGSNAIAIQMQLVDGHTSCGCS